MNLRRAALLAGTSLLFSASVWAWGSPSRLFGDWKTPDGSTVRTFPCAEAVCLRIVNISATAPGSVDANNPDPALRSRSLCNLQIGSSFTPSGDNEARGGNLYDPESGKTYKGNMVLDGDTLRLRGYVGIALFGRTETWHRTSAATSCK